MNINDTEFLKKLRSTFKIEAYEHLRTISLSLLELEKITSKEEQKPIVEVIHREFHSLKGAARAVSIKEIETLCHTLESIFTKVKKDSLKINEDMFDIFNRAVDMIEESLSLPEDKSKDMSTIINELKNVEGGILSSSALLKPKEVQQESVIVTDADFNKEIKEIKEKLVMNEIIGETTDTTKSSKKNADEVIRVSKGKFDSLLLQGEEMIYAKLSAAQRAKEIKELRELLDLWKKEKEFNIFKRIENNLETLLKSAENDVKTIETMTDTFMEEVKGIMVSPFSSVVEMFPKMVRDLSRQIGKEIDFIVSGKEIEIDRRILEEIKDPFMHIIRNSIDHGIESRAEREKRGKPIKGVVNLSISQISGDKVKIDISDDGAGIDLDKVKEKAIRNKLITKEQADNLDKDTANMLIFKSGLSTSDIITDISGRGLGLAIAFEKIQKLEGNITINTEKGRGTTFTIYIPITISTNRGIIVKASKQDFVIPTGKVEKVMIVKRDDVKILENRATILVDERIVPIIKLKDILELKDKESKEELNDTFSILVINHIDKNIALSVDSIVSEQEVLIKRFNKQLKRVKNISGATILGSGEVVPILNVQDLIKSSLIHGNKSLNIINDNQKDNSKYKNVIVVEDSITSRTLLKNILEAYGYSVKTAVDGLQGWNLLKSEKFDLVITDVEMPEMNGFELTSKIRNDSDLSEMPVILVTSLESREDKERGIDVGASAYIVKSDFQQGNLLEIIKRLI